MKRIATVILALAVSSAAHAQHVKWYYDIHDVSFGQTAAKDIDGDGKLELVFSTYWNDSNAYCLNAENGTLKWKHKMPGPLGGCNDAGPLIIDPFGNGNYKVVIPGSCMDTTFCLDADSGYVQWKAVTGGGDSPPSCADIDHDGDLDVLHGTFDGHVVCLDGKTGAINWKVLVDTNAAIESEPAIMDAEHNGTLDFVVATWDFTNDSNRISCFRGSNHSLVWENRMPKNLLYHGTAFGDLDHDGKYELTIGDYDGYAWCLNAENGSLVWKDTAYVYVGAPTTLADLDNDGYLDVIYCDGANVIARKHDKSPLWSYPISGQGSFRGVAVADVNNDNYLDVTFGTGDGQVISLDGHNGSVIRQVNMNTIYQDTFEIDNAPIIADFDGDDTLDLFIVGGKTRYPNTVIDYGRAYCMSWGVGKGPDWTMFRHDDRRSACVCDSVGLPWHPTDVANIKATEAGELIVTPNPNSGDFMLNFSLSANADAIISVTDIMGREVLPPRRNSYKKGYNTEYFRDEAGILAPGIYLVQLQTPQYRQTTKLIISR
jgi:outer membrane protein assembly factor BamB